MEKVDKMHASFVYFVLIQKCKQIGCIRRLAGKLTAEKKVSTANVGKIEREREKKV